MSAVPHSCADPDCEFCQKLAEERADYEWGNSDWQIGQDRYERSLDAMGPQC